MSDSLHELQPPKLMNKKMRNATNSTETKINIKSHYENQVSYLSIKQIPCIYNILFLIWPSHMACGILVPQPGIKPVTSALEAQS